MGLVEYLVSSKDDIADPCNRAGRESVKVSAYTLAFLSAPLLATCQLLRGYST
jgi:hypothetical protein